MGHVGSYLYGLKRIWDWRLSFNSVHRRKADALNAKSRYFTNLEQMMWPLGMPKALKLSARK